MMATLLFNTSPRFVCLSRYFKPSMRTFSSNRFEEDCAPYKKKPPEPPPSVCVERIRCPQEIPDCPRPCPGIPSKSPPMTRLKKRKIKIKFIPICIPEKCPRRADEGMVVKQKTLPTIRPRQCVCVEPPPLKDFGGLKRLKRKTVIQKIPECIPEKCPPRADEGLKLKEKVLPYIPPGDCKCIEPTFTDTAPLKRLVKRYVPPPPANDAPPECHPPPCLPNIQIVTRKRLPILKAKCKCVEPPPLTDVPLVRLKKDLVCPQPKTLPCFEKECTTPRADDLCNYKIREKTLPTLVLCEDSNEVSIYQYQKLKKGKK